MLINSYLNWIYLTHIMALWAPLLPSADGQGVAHLTLSRPDKLKQMNLCFLRLCSAHCVLLHIVCLVCLYIGLYIVNMNKLLINSYWTEFILHYTQERMLIVCSLSLLVPHSLAQRELDVWRAACVWVGMANCRMLGIPSLVFLERISFLNTT